MISGCDGCNCGGLQKRQEVLQKMHHRAYQPWTWLEVAGSIPWNTLEDITDRTTSQIHLPCIRTLYSGMQNVNRSSVVNI